MRYINLRYLLTYLLTPQGTPLFCPLNSAPLANTSGSAAALVSSSVQRATICQMILILVYLSTEKMNDQWYTWLRFNRKFD